MAKHQNPFGGGPRIGNSAPGEPADSPVAQMVGGFGGAPTLNTTHNRGEKCVNPDGGSEHFPAPYGGGEPLTTFPDQKRVKGGGANVGAGATSGSTQPVP